MIVLEGIEEHRFIDFLMERLQEAAPENEPFDAKFRILVQNVEYHLEKEEGELFREQEGAAENFFSHLKEEYLRQFPLPSFEQAQQLVADYIHFYNYERIQLKTRQTPYQTRCLSQ